MNLLGYLTGVESDYFVKEFEYKKDGKLKYDKIEIKNWRTLETDYSYLDNGMPNLIETTVTNLEVSEGEPNRTKTFTYEHTLDSLGRTKDIIFNNTNLKSYTYDNFNRVNSVLLPNDLKVSYEYDPVTQKERKYYQKSADTDETKFSHDWNINNRGFLADEGFNFHDESDVFNRAYNYSKRGFLDQSSDNDNTHKYLYDESGFMTTHRKTDNGHAELDSVFEYELNNWKIGDKNYKVDNAGRVTKRLNKTYTYGAQGRITSVSENGVVLAEYIYDEAGLPFIKKKDNKITEYYLNPGKVNSALLTNEALFQPVEVMGRVVGVLENENFIPIKADFRNSFLEDENGIRNISSPYGDRLNKYRVEHGTGPGKFSTIIDFASKGYDVDLDLVRMGHRYQDNVSKRFITPDPLFMESPEKCVESPGECNLYGYAGNNPVNYLDPEGLVLIIKGDTAGPYSAASMDWGKLFGALNDSYFRHIDVNDIVLRGLGTLQAVGGLTQIGAGYFSGNPWLVMNGLDEYYSGSMTATTGYQHQTFKYNLTKAVTNSDKVAMVVDIGLGMKAVQSMMKVKPVLDLPKTKTCSGGQCAPGEPVCFTEGSIILVSNGKKEIQDIKKGDLVYSQNLKTGEVELKKVIETFIKETNKLITLELADGSKIETTYEHPFWVVGIGWVKSGELSIYDELLLYNQERIKVKDFQIRIYKKAVKVYNFEVEGNHNYFVGSGVLVHNSCWPWKSKTASIKELGKGNCSSCAIKIQNSIGGDIIYIHDSISNFGIGHVKNMKGEKISSNWFHHYAVRKGDMIFDRITGPNGLHIDDYKKLFQYGDDGLVFDTVVKASEVVH